MDAKEAHGRGRAIQPGQTPEDRGRGAGGAPDGGGGGAAGAPGADHGTGGTGQAGPPPASVHVRPRKGSLELRFRGRFTPEDLAAVKAIPGRRWDLERRSWLLPHVPQTLVALKGAFGARLVVPRELAGGRAEAATVRQDLDLTRTVRSGTRRLLEVLGRVIKTRGYSPKTEKAYVGWVRRFLTFVADRSDGALRSIDSLGAFDATAFLEHLAVSRRLAARSRNQAASALGFMFREILGSDVMAGVARAKGPTRLPRVLSHEQVLAVLRQLVGKYFLIVVLMYSAGLRVREALRLRLQDIDFELGQIIVRDGKGEKDRYVPLAKRAMGLLRAQMRRVARRHDADLKRGHGWAPMPDALHRKKPNAGYELRWQFLFPARTINVDPATGRSGRWPLHESAVQREVTDAVRASGILKSATAHTFRHSFATEALRGGCDIRTLQHVMGHKDIRTTMIYLHVVEQSGAYIKSPLDRPDKAEYEHDPVGRPWSDERIEWDLAAKQWGRKRRPTETKDDDDEQP